MHLRCTLAAAAAALALSSSPARAEERWYGYHVLATDAGGWGLILVGAKSEAGPLILLGAGTLVLGGPIVHAARDRWATAGKSLGLRVGAPLLGLTLGGVIGLSGDKGEKSGLEAIAYAVAGMIIGYAAAAITDIAYLAREDVPDAAPRMFTIGGRF